jgi:hypothetical protein
MAAHAVAADGLPAYSHRFSPKKFTQHQLFAILVLKEFLRTDYRGVCQHLADCPGLRDAIELSAVPHWTTVQKAADRLLKKTPRIASWIRRCAMPPTADSSRKG